MAEPFEAALRDNPQLRVVVVIPLVPDIAGLNRVPQYLGRERALTRLMRLAPGRVAAYGIENHAGTPVYVHAKVCVIDDVWASTGSDNFNRRSWTHDSELSAVVLDEDERAFQEGFLHGPAPIGPGAPPCERLMAFGDSLLDHIEANWELMLEGEAMNGGCYAMTPPYRVRWLHVHALVSELRPTGDIDYLTDVLLAPLTATVYAQQRIAKGMALDRIKAGYRDLVMRALG